MKRRHIIVLFVICSLMDLVLQYYFPGLFWFVPGFIMACMVVGVAIEKHILLMLSIGIISDLSSGMRFGIVLLSIIVAWCTFLLIKKMIRRLEESLSLKIVTYLLISIVFYTVLALFRGVHREFIGYAVIACISGTEFLVCYMWASSARQSRSLHLYA